MRAHFGLCREIAVVMMTGKLLHGTLHITQDQLRNEEVVSDHKQGKCGCCETGL